MTTMKRSLTRWLNWPAWGSGRPRAARERRPSEDCADYGTAFGLDMSIESQNHAEPAASSAADTALPGDRPRGRPGA